MKKNTVKIVAEIGCNHKGNFEIAKKIGDYFIYLENGKILLQGNDNKFFDNFSL